MFWIACLFCKIQFLQELLDEIAKLFYVDKVKKGVQAFLNDSECLLFGQANSKFHVSIAAQFNSNFFVFAD